MYIFSNVEFYYQEGRLYYKKIKKPSLSSRRAGHLTGHPTRGHADVPDGRTDVLGGHAHTGHAHVLRGEGGEPAVGGLQGRHAEKKKK